MALFRPTIFAQPKSRSEGGDVGARKGAVGREPSARTTPLRPDAHREGRGKAERTHFRPRQREVLGHVRGSA